MFVVLLLFGIVISLIWFIVTDFSILDARAPLAIATITTFFAAMSAFANLLQAVETQKQREASERPYVVSYFDGTGSGAICFMIENRGNSPAKDLIIEFSPSPIDHTGNPLDQISLFTNPISFLPPGQIIRQIIDAGYRFFDQGKPTRFKVTMRYSSIANKPFKESITHDLEYLKQTTHPLKSLGERLKDISDELKDLNKTFDRVRGMNSLLVQSPRSYYRSIRQPRGCARYFEWFIRLFDAS
jgi:hypothetical protein